jgi:hypothetical protein
VRFGLVAALAASLLFATAGDGLLAQTMAGDIKLAMSRTPPPRDQKYCFAERDCCCESGGLLGKLKARKCVDETKCVSELKGKCVYDPKFRNHCS